MSNDLLLDHQTGDMDLAKIQDLEKVYTIAMDLVKVTPKRRLTAIGATYRHLCKEDNHPNTRDLVNAILERAGSSTCDGEPGT